MLKITKKIIKKRKHESRNDHLIDEVLKDSLYKFTRDGKGYSKLTLNGQGVTDEWREIGYKKKDGYVRFRYKDDFLFLQRVIYRKYNGELKPNMTVNHKNLDNSDNRPENLELISQGDNNKKKHKKYKKHSKKEIVNLVVAKLKKDEEISAIDEDYKIHDKVETNIKKAVNQAIKTFKSKIPIWNNIRVIYTHSPKNSDHLGRFRSGTENNPIILLFPESIKKASKEYNADLVESIESTIYHELGHALIELASDLDVDMALIPDNEEDFVEDFAYEFTRSFLIIPKMKKVIDFILKGQKVKKGKHWKEFIRGEYWITEDGNSEFADSDVGEKSHEYIAIEHMLNGEELLEALKEYNNRQEDSEDKIDLKEYEDFGDEYSLGATLFFNVKIPDEVGEKVVGKEIWSDLKKDVRLAYAKHKGAIHVIDNNFAAYKITAKSIKNIQDFIYDQIEEKEPKGEVVIEEFLTKKDITLEVNDFLNIKHPSELWRLTKNSKNIVSRFLALTI